MADLPLPRTAGEAVVQLLWGTVIFALGFEGVVKVVEGEFATGLCCLLAALLLTLVLVYRVQIANFIGRNMTPLLVGAAIIGALLLGFALGGLFLRGSSLLANRPSTGRLVWNFDDPAKRETDFVLVMAASNPKEIRVGGVQVVGKNTSSDPVTQFKGILRADRTNRTDPFYLIAAEVPSHGPFDQIIPTLPEETYGIPGLADFRAQTFDKVFFSTGVDGVPAEQFLREFVPFTLIFEYDGLKIERHFSKQQIENELERFERFANPANSALVPRVTRKPNAAPPKSDFPPLHEIKSPDQPKEQNPTNQEAPSNGNSH